MCQTKSLHNRSRKLIHPKEPTIGTPQNAFSKYLRNPTSRKVSISASSLLARLCPTLYFCSMLQIVIALFCAALLLPMQAQTAAAEKKAPTVAIPNVFTFDEESPGKMPAGWGGGQANTISVDDSVAHSGKNSVRIVRDFESAGSFSTISRKIPLSYSGESLELRGFLSTESVSGFAGLWMREDQDGAPVAFDNMQARELKGTTGWTEYSIKLPLRSDAQMLYIGVLVSGTGKV
jgi:hypothetical protein